MHNSRMYLRRSLEATIKEVSQQFPVVLVTGPRQVGKTTLLQKICSKSRRYVTLDGWENRQLANSDPKLFLAQYPPPVIIDEVQYAPGLFSHIKLWVDQEKKTSLFWLSGSQQFPLMKNLSESLSGRVAILKLLGLSSSEIHKTKKIFLKTPWLPFHSSKMTSPIVPFKKLSQHIFQ